MRCSERRGVFCNEVGGLESRNWVIRLYGSQKFGVCPRYDECHWRLSQRRNLWYKLKKKKRKKFLASVLKVHCQLLVIMSPVCDLLWETIWAGIIFGSRTIEVGRFATCFELEMKGFDDILSERESLRERMNQLFPLRR